MLLRLGRQLLQRRQHLKIWRPVHARAAQAMKTWKAILPVRWNCSNIRFSLHCPAPVRQREPHWIYAWPLWPHCLQLKGAKTTTQVVGIQIRSWEADPTWLGFLCRLHKAPVWDWAHTLANLKSPETGRLPTGINTLCTWSTFCVTCSGSHYPHPHAQGLQCYSRTLVHNSQCRRQE